MLRVGGRTWSEYTVCIRVAWVMVWEGVGVRSLVWEWGHGGRMWEWAFALLGPIGMPNGEGRCAIAGEWGGGVRV